LSNKPKINFIRIKSLVGKDKFLIVLHANERMVERNISTDQAITAILTGEIVETHEELNPCPTARILGYVDGLPINVVVAQCKDKIRIITVYIGEDRK
jgi:hypothetical protein